MDCITNCKSPNQILDGLSVTDLGCSKKVARFNRALRNFYLSTAGWIDNIVYEPIVSLGGLETIQTDHSIYKVMGFFTTSTSEGITGNYCGSKTTTVQIAQTTLPPQNDEYIITCDNEIQVKFHKPFEGYLLYSRGPSVVTDMNVSNICISNTMLSGLEYFLEQFYAVVEQEPNNITIFTQLYNNWEKEIKKAQGNWVFSIVSGRGTMQNARN